jgi:hypothetical protein
MLGCVAIMACGSAGSSVEDVPPPSGAYELRLELEATGCTEPSTYADVW